MRQRSQAMRFGPMVFSQLFPFNHALWIADSHRAVNLNALARHSATMRAQDRASEKMGKSSRQLRPRCFRRGDKGQDSGRKLLLIWWLRSGFVFAVAFSQWAIGSWLENLELPPASTRMTGGGFRNWHSTVLAEIFSVQKKRQPLSVAATHALAHIQSAR